jgi:hypothetical protein
LNGNNIKQNIVKTVAIVINGKDNSDDIKDGRKNLKKAQSAFEAIK